MPYSFKNLPTSEPDPSQIWVDLAQEEPSEIMQLHDSLISTHTVEMSDDLTELWVSGGRFSVTDSKRGFVTLYIWPYSGGSPLVIADNLLPETALEFLQATQS